MTIQSHEENPKGLHRRYHIDKLVYEDGYNVPTKIPVDPDAEYFVMRLDNGGSDPKHVAACRKAVLVYAEEIKDHLPELAADLIEKYS